MKKYSHKYQLIQALFLIILLNACTEEFVPKTEAFENLLVIEANITDELKRQEVLITRTFRFEEDSSLAERNADVKVVDDQSNEYLFEEETPGIYHSVEPFQAIPEREYSLLITTTDDRSYTSDPVILPPKARIDNLYAERITSDDGLMGIGIFVNSFDPLGQAAFYRYEFDETYRFNAPKFNFLDLRIISSNPLEVDFVRRSIDKRTCYKTDTSAGVLITKTEDFDQNRVSDFLVRFIDVNNYIISDRYSILVKQFVQSENANTFYETLLRFSNSETLFSQIQPGFIRGNIRSPENIEENVLGLFQVTSVSKKRIFFNYRDFFLTEDLPPYFGDCFDIAPPIQPRPNSFLRTLFSGQYVFTGLTGENNFNRGPYLLTTRACGDCTAIASSEPPSFWED